MAPKRRVMNPEGKRAAIMACAERLFAANGYSGTSMTDIAGAADVAVGTVYRLFPDKASLLAALHAQMEDRFIAAMKTGWGRAEAFPDRFVPMLDALFDEAERVREIMPLYAMTRDMIGAADYIPGARMITSIETMYRQGIRAGAFHAMPAGIVGPVAHAMVEGGMRAWMAKPTPDHLRRVKTELAALFQRAFVKA